MALLRRNRQRRIAWTRERYFNGISILVLATEMHKDQTADKGNLYHRIAAPRKDVQAPVTAKGCHRHTYHYAAISHFPFPPLYPLLQPLSLSLWTTDAPSFLLLPAICMPAAMLLRLLAPRALPPAVMATLCILSRCRTQKALTWVLLLAPLASFAPMLLCPVPCLLCILFE